MRKLTFIITFAFTLGYTSVHGQANPKLLQRSFYQKQDTAWKMFIKESYGYDEMERLRSIVSLRKDGDQWVNHLKKEYRYPGENSDTLQIEIVSEAGNNHEWGEPSWIITIKDPNGNAVSETHTQPDIAKKSWALSVKGDMIRDEKGRLVEKRYAKPDTTGWKNEDRTLFSYTNTSMMGDEIQQSWKNGKWENYQRTVYEYNGNTVTCRNIFTADNITHNFKQIPDTRHLYVYDTYGNLAELLIQKNVNGKWEDRSKRVSSWTENR